MKHVAIIGGGIGGLATAALLAKAGYNVTVYEKNEQLGGRAGLLEIDGFRFDTGPSWYLMPDVFQHFFELLGRSVDNELSLVRLAPAYKVFFENESPIVVTSQIDKDVETFEAIEPGSGEMLRKYVALSEHIYRLSLDHFLYTNFTDPRDVLHRNVLKNGVSMATLTSKSIHSHVSQYVSDQRLQQILEYPMVFLGTSPFSAPAIYSLMSALDFNEGVFYPRGGMYTIIERIIDAGKDLGVTYRTNCEVAKITTGRNSATGIKLASGEEISADIVISNGDIHHTETQLLEPRLRSFPNDYWAKKEASPSALLLYLGVKEKLPQLEHHNLLFVRDWKENFKAIFDEKKMPLPASMYICKPSATDDSIAPKGHENVFVLVPLPAGIELNGEEQEALVDEYLQQIHDMTNVDLRQHIVSKTVFGPNDFRTKYFSWQNSMLGQSHRLAQSALFRTPNKSKKVTNLYYVGASTTPGIGLPMCLIGAELVYKRISGDTRGGRVKSIEKAGM